MAFLYDLTASDSYFLSGRSVAEDRQLPEVVECVLAQLTNSDSLRFGFVSRHVYLSRPYLASERTDFYRAVVKPTAVPAADRIGPSPIWDALDRTVSLMASDSGRRAVIVMTDGMSTGNVHGMDEVIAHAKAENVSVSAIYMGVPFALWKEWPVHPGETLSAIATATGGSFIVPTDTEYREYRQSATISKKTLKEGMSRIFEVLRR